VVDQFTKGESCRTQRFGTADLTGLTLLTGGESWWPDLRKAAVFCPASFLFLTLSPFPTLLLHVAPFTI